MKRQLFRYWYAMNASAIQSAAHSAKAYIAVATAHAISSEVPALNLQQLLWIFLLAFGQELLNYLDTHPLPGLSSPQPPTT